MQDLTRMICEEQARLTISILSRTKLESKVCFRTKKKKTRKQKLQSAEKFDSNSTECPHLKAKSERLMDIKWKKKSNWNIFFN